MVDRYKKYYGERAEVFDLKTYDPQEARATIEKYYRKAFPGAKVIKITLISKDMVTFQQYAAFIGDTTGTLS